MGSDLFVTDQKNGIGEYTTSGAVVNASLIPGLQGAGAIAIVPTVAPEPSTLLLVPLGLIAVGIIRVSRLAVLPRTVPHSCRRSQPEVLEAEKKDR